ncbi:MAG: DUF805 domain-containing protein [Gammaproteobacteria bacterium]|nr:DUF805 domain-containing protein [Gammaproteobacteria bacterium]
MMTDNNNNPYATPKSQIVLLDDDVEYNTSKWYSLSGRIGRLQYLAYSVLISLVTLPIWVLGVAIIPTFNISPDSALVPIIIFVSLLPWIFYWSFIYPIRRLHDLGHTGWLILINLVPLVNIIFSLYLIFAPGEKTSNEYGAMPRPNKWYHWVLAILFPILIIGLVAISSLAEQY